MSESKAVIRTNLRKVFSRDYCSMWRILSGLIAMPSAVVLDNLYSPDASDRFAFICIVHFILWPYSLVLQVVAAFINEHFVNAYIKYSVVAVLVGTLVIGSVAASLSLTPFGWLTAFFVTLATRVHYVRTNVPNRRPITEFNVPALSQ